MSNESLQYNRGDSNDMTELNKITIDTPELDAENADIQETNNNYKLDNDYIFELFLKKIAEKALGYKWMHNQDRYMNSNINYVFRIIEIIILALLGTVTCSEIILLNLIIGNKDIFNYVILCIQIVLIFFNLIIRGIREFTDFNSLSENHRQYAIKFGLINNLIQEKFISNSKNKEDKECFLKDITKSYNDLLEGAPSIRKKTLNKYIKFSEDNEINKQIIIGGYDKIEIIINNDSDKSNLKISSKQENHNDKYKFEMERWLKVT